MGGREDAQLLALLADARADVERAYALAAEHVGRRDALIREAFASGVERTRVVAAAGISRGMVFRIAASRGGTDV